MTSPMYSKLYEKIGQWNELQRQLEAIKQQELTLRKELFEEAFANPAEGTNTLDLPEGWKLKGNYKLNRKLDEAALPEVLKELRKLHVKTDSLIKYKPELSTTEFRKLTPEQEKVLAAAMVTTPGTPSLELVAPKGAK